MDDRALNTFIRRKYQCPWRRMRSMYGLCLILSVIICYFSVLAGLNHLDNTPNWARIKVPRVIPLGKPFEVGVRFKGIMRTAQLSMTASLRDHNNRYLYSIRHSDPVYEIIGAGRKTFQFALPTDPNIASVQFHAECQDSPAERSRPSQQANKQRRPVYSDRIPAHANSLEIPSRQAPSMSWADIFKRALHDGHWRKHAGDYTPMGWSITGLYLLGVVICMVCIKNPRQHTPSHTWFWWMCALALLLLGINKQLDLQMLLADLGRTYAKSHAWYTLRKPVQIQAVSITLALCLGLVEIILFKLRQCSKVAWLALFGLMTLALYFGLRLVSLHQVDKYLALSCRGLTIGNLTEVGGILCVSLSALIYCRGHMRPQAQYILR